VLAPGLLSQGVRGSVLFAPCTHLHSQQDPCYGYAVVRTGVEAKRHCRGPLLGNQWPSGLNVMLCGALFSRAVACRAAHRRARVLAACVAAAADDWDARAAGGGAYRVRLRVRRHCAVRRQHVLHCSLPGAPDPRCAAGIAPAAPLAPAAQRAAGPLPAAPLACAVQLSYGERG